MRYEYKMACFAEFRGEDEVALKSVSLYPTFSLRCEKRATEQLQTLPGFVFDTGDYVRFDSYLTAEDEEVG